MIKKVSEKFLLFRSLFFNYNREREKKEEVLSSMRKVFRTGIAGVLLGSMLLTGCGSSEVKVPDPKPPVWEEAKEAPWSEEENELRLVQITDPHFYSPALTDGGEEYQRVMESAAGRAALDIDKILESFAKEMKELMPDALIVSGDMTVNGEKKSHEDFAAYLSELEKAGIEVFVIPGNHDINNLYAGEIRDTGVTKAENVTPEEFLTIYKEFGYDEALERDAGSLSYVAEVSEKLWVLMLDTCIYKDNRQDVGVLSYETKKWAVSVAERAKEQGKKLISVTHHNMLPHNTYFSENYTIGNSTRFAEELADAGVQLNLSGHMHIMHITQNKKNLKDVALESLAVWPNLYGQLDINKEGDMYYHTRQVKYEGNAYRYLYQANWGRTYERLGEYELSEEERREMTDFLTELNADYFSGRVGKKELYTSREGYRLWQEMPADDSHSLYIEEMLNSSEKNHSSLLIENEE